MRHYIRLLNGKLVGVSTHVPNHIGISFPDDEEVEVFYNWEDFKKRLEELKREAEADESETDSDASADGSGSVVS